MKSYVTFGQDHIHKINGKVFDKDCIAIVHGDRATVFEIFGPKFCFEYSEVEWNAGNMTHRMEYYPRGYIEVREEVVQPLQPEVVLSTVEPVKTLIEEHVIQLFEAAFVAERERICVAIKAADQTYIENDCIMNADNCISVILGHGHNKTGVMK